MTNSILYVILNRQDGQFLQFHVEYTDPNKNSFQSKRWELVIDCHSRKDIQHIIEWTAPDHYDNILEACMEYEKSNERMGEYNSDMDYVCVTDYHNGGRVWMSEKKFDDLLTSEKIY